jgi:hypothetical protein
MRSLSTTAPVPLTCFSQEARDAFYMKNYPDWFASIDKTLIKKPDGSFVVSTQVFALAPADVSEESFS